MSRRADQKVSYWKVKSLLENGLAVFKCECGTIRTLLVSRVASYSSRSCGCMKKKRLMELSTTHGMTNTPMYTVWRNFYYKNKSLIPAEWQDFLIFLKDVGERPSNKHSLKRLDFNAPFSKSNFYWSTNQQERKPKNRNGRSKYPHVTYHEHRKKWIIRVTIEGKRVLLGSFDTEDEAGAAVADFYKKTEHPYSIDPLRLSIAKKIREGLSHSSRDPLWTLLVSKDSFREPKVRDQIADAIIGGRNGGFAPGWKLVFISKPVVQTLIPIKSVACTKKVKSVKKAPKVREVLPKPWQVGSHIIEIGLGCTYEIPVFRLPYTVIEVDKKRRQIVLQRDRVREDGGIERNLSGETLRAVLSKGGVFKALGDGDFPLTLGIRSI